MEVIKRTIILLLPVLLVSCSEQTDISLNAFGLEEDVFVSGNTVHVAWVDETPPQKIYYKKSTDEKFGLDKPDGLQSHLLITHHKAFDNVKVNDENSFVITKFQPGFEEETLEPLGIENSDFYIYILTTLKLFANYILLNN